MQETTMGIDRTAGMPQTVDVTAPVREKVQQLNRWLDSRSGFYSRLMGKGEVTWRQALRIGVVLPAMLVMVAGCAVQAPLVAAVCMVSAGWTVYRLNSDDEKGGKV